MLSYSFLERPDPYSNHDDTIHLIYQIFYIFRRPTFALCLTTRNLIRWFNINHRWYKITAKNQFKKKIQNLFAIYITVQIELKTSYVFFIFIIGTNDKEARGRRVYRERVGASGNRVKCEFLCIFWSLLNWFRHSVFNKQPNLGGII